MDDRAFNPHLMKTMPKPAAQPKQRAPGDDFSVRAGRENEQVYRTPAPGTSGMSSHNPTGALTSTVLADRAAQQKGNPSLNPSLLCFALLCDLHKACSHLQAAARPTTALGRARPSPSSTQTS